MSERLWKEVALYQTHTRVAGEKQEAGGGGDCVMPSQTRTWRQNCLRPLEGHLGRSGQPLKDESVRSMYMTSQVARRTGDASRRSTWIGLLLLVADAGKERKDGTHIRSRIGRSRAEERSGEYCP